MKNKVFFSNRQKNVAITPEIKAGVRKVLSLTLSSEGFPSPAEVSVSFVANDEIRSLNLSYRGIDRETDVLSFPMLEGDDVISVADEPCALGDIVISAEKAEAQAALYGHGLMREIMFLTVHSTLHLLGYDHVTSAGDEKYMNEKQEEILIKAGYPRKDV